MLIDNIFERTYHQLRTLRPMDLPFKLVTLRRSVEQLEHVTQKYHHAGVLHSRSSLCTWKQHELWKTMERLFLSDFSELPYA